MTIQRKIFVVIATGIFIIGVLGGIYYFFQYFFALAESNNEALEANCKKEISSGYKGTIENIQKYEYSDYMNKNFIGFDILTYSDSSKYFHYQFKIDGNEDLINFTGIGDSIIKHPNEELLTIKKESGDLKSFKLPNCKN